MIQEGPVRVPWPQDAWLERLQRMPLFQGFSPREVERVAFMARRRFLDPREEIHAAGSPEVAAFLVLSGVVLLEAGEDGRIGVMVRPGGTFGEESLFDEGPRPHGARAVMRTEVLCWDEEDLGRLERDHPRLAAKFLRRLARPLTQRWRKWVAEAAEEPVVLQVRPGTAAEGGGATWWQRFVAAMRARWAARLPEVAVVSVQPGGTWEPVPLSRWPVTYEG
ncbi:MAG: Crp/Fnr family transcriptional regulator [Candidatus Sericytochromatia bacterium]|nr:Crp/Fnr family transcriptional regulator [Candidatus Tanganyikabacteria bacterium]